MYFFLARVVTTVLCFQFMLCTAFDLDTRLAGSLTLGARANPRGLGLLGDFSLTKRIYDSEHILGKLNFIQPYLAFAISPTVLQGGMGLKLQPISLFGMNLSLQEVKYFGTYGHLQSSSSPNFEWSDTAVSNRAKAAKNEDNVTSAEFNNGQPVISGQKIGGQFLTASVYVQGMTKLLLGKIEIGHMKYMLNLAKNSIYFYDPGEDLLVKNNKEVLFIKSDLVTKRSTFSETLEPLQLGLSYRQFNAFVTGQFQKDASKVQSKNERLGPTILFSFTEAAQTATQDKVLGLLVQFYITHPYRTKQPLPCTYLVFNWDFSVTSF